MQTIYSKRLVAAEKQVLVLPRDYKVSAQASNPYGVIYCHGNGDSALSPLDPSGKTGQYRLLQAMVDAGFPVLSMDNGQTGVTPGGMNAWGNATGTTRVGAGVTHLHDPAHGGAKTGKVILVGVSMGNIVAMNYAKANPTKVAGVFGAIPACDLDDFYTNNRGNLRATVGTAHGVAWPTALPAGVNPLTSPGSLGTIPTRLSYSTADTICIPSTVTALGAAIGSQLIVHSTTLEHSEASLLSMNLPALITWMKSLT